ncbi:MAG TPA: hypothetical protein VFF02_05610 [Anaeromyxobacteraceae bacterium]|nr:hypothetical protein [Anaeromyxobacteraceae bacterium]
MKKALKVIAAAAILAGAHQALATPSTTYWTPATNYTQPFLVPHITYDTYFGEPGAYPIITGLTMGVLPFEKIQAEVGFDLFYPARGESALFLNGKLTLVEGAFGEWSPGLSVGIMSVGFKTDVTDYNMLWAFLGKNFGPIGTLGVGGYYGLNEKLWVDATGAKQQSGVLASWMGPDFKVGLTGLDKIVLAADVQTGKNVFGAAGGGVYLYFTPAIDLLMGPVFFFEKALQPGQASWLWTMQLDVDVDFSKPTPPKT